MFTVVGESLVDVVTRAGSAERAEYVGGSPANVAVGLARLGAEVELVTQYGRDDRGRRIADTLTAAGVGLSAALVTDAPTATATATLDDRGQASYDFALGWDPGPLAVPAGTRVLHTGSLATAVEPGAAETVALLRRLAALAREGADTVLVSFDPNCRPAILGSPEAARARIEQVVTYAHVVKASEEDLAWLYPGRSAEETMAAWLAAGPALVVLTRGDDGAVALGRSARAVRDAPQVEVADTVGAGDSFTAALLQALARRLARTPSDVAALDAGALDEVLRRAVTAAALTCSRPGADPPSAAELDRALGGGSGASTDAERG